MLKLSICNVIVNQKGLQWRWKTTFLWAGLYFTRYLSAKIHILKRDSNSGPLSELLLEFETDALSHSATRAGFNVMFTEEYFYEQDLVLTFLVSLLYIVLSAGM